MQENNYTGGVFMKKNKWKNLAIILVVVFVGLLAAGCSDGEVLTAGESDLVLVNNFGQGNDGSHANTNEQYTREENTTPNTHLRLENKHIENFSFLENHYHIETLTISRGSISSFDYFVENLPNLRTLRIFSVNVRRSAGDVPDVENLLDLRLTPPFVYHEVEGYDYYFFTVTGVVTSVKGLSADGSVPDYIDWLHINILDEYGNDAIIIGMNSTAFFFDGALEEGSVVRAYIPKDMPYIIHDTPMYIASIMVSGMDVEINTVRRIHYFSDDYPPRVQTTIVASKEDSEVVFHPFNLFRNWHWWHIVSLEAPEKIDISNTLNHIFSISRFSIIDLDVMVKGRIIENLPPVLVNDDGVIMVPFRSIVDIKPVGLLNFDVGAYLDENGILHFSTGGGSMSEISRWRLGSRYIRRPHVDYFPLLDSPPILVNGIIYVPLMTSFEGNDYFFSAVPFTNATLFEDRVEINGGWN